MKINHQLPICICIIRSLLHSSFSFHTFIDFNYRIIFILFRCWLDINVFIAVFPSLLMLFLLADFRAFKFDLLYTVFFFCVVVCIHDLYFHCNEINTQITDQHICKNGCARAHSQQRQFNNSNININNNKIC